MSTPPVNPDDAAPPALRWGRLLMVALAMAGLWVSATLLAGEYHERQAERARTAVEAGRALTTAARLPQAAAAFRTAVALEPDEPAYRLSLAKALVGLDRMDEAERYLQDVLRVDATNGDANLALARIHRAAGRFAAAEAAYYRAIYGRWPPEAEATRVQTRLELIELLGQTADRERVRAELTHLATAFPGDRALLLRVGRQLLDSGFAEDARRLYRGVIDRFTDPGAAHAGLAEAALALDDYAAAAAAARRALAANPDDRASAERLALASTVDSLDPTRPRLSARERTRRTRRLLDLARLRLEACWAAGPATPEHEALLARLAATRTTRVTPAVLDEETALLETAAAAVAASCPPSGADAPLDLVLRVVVSAGAGTGAPS